MSKALVNTYTVLAYCETTINSYLELYNEVLSKEENKIIIERIKIMKKNINNSFKCWNGKITQKELNKVNIIATKLGELTFISGKEDLIAFLSFCIGLVEDLLDNIKHEIRRKTLKLLIESMREVQYLFDPNLDNNYCYKLGKLAIDQYNILKKRYL